MIRGQDRLKEGIMIEADQLKKAILRDWFAK